MKKTLRKLVFQRETLQVLSSMDLTGAAGALAKDGAKGLRPAFAITEAKTCGVCTDP